MWRTGGKDQGHRNAVDRDIFKGVFLILAVTVIGSLVVTSWESWRLVNEPLHATMEALGGLAAIAIATLLLRWKQEESGKLFLVAMGFLGMGMLDILHGASRPGQGFVFLHGVASLVGGFWFAMVWVPRFASDRYVAWKNWIPYVVITGSILLWIWTLLAPETLPVMLRNGEYTTNARAINFLAGVLFVAASWRLMLDFRRSKKLESYLFTFIALLFGLAELPFTLSSLWGSEWWFYHLLRLVAYLLVGGLVVREHRLVEDELRKSEMRFEGIVQTIPEAVISVNVAQCITLFNKGAEEIFGYQAEEVLDRPLDLLLPARFTEAHRQHIRDFAAAPETVRWMGERREIFGRRKNGTEFPAEGTIFKLTEHGQMFFTVTLRDITERRRMEEESMKHRDHLEQLVKERTAELETVNKELEAFSYSVSHDLRAPLRSINGFSLALLEDYAGRLEEQGKDYLNRVCEASKYMALLIDDLLKLSRVTRSEMKREPVDLSAIAQRIASELQKSQPERRVEFANQEGLTMEGDVRLLGIVLENLLSNAWKFTGKQERARIEFGATKRDGRSAFYVRDNGAGFDMAYANKLFTPFQRLHAPTEFPGTGIGLATVQRIIHRHGGRVWAEGEVGKGATFYFQIQRTGEGG